MDFLEVHDIFMTEAAELADVVFPAAWVEREGINYHRFEEAAKRNPLGLPLRGASGNAHHV